jgi:ribosomal protein S18 acetylase RimI-like enzyme
VIRQAQPAEAHAIAAAHAEAHWETYAPLLGDAARRLDPAPLELAWRRAFRDKAIIRVAEDAGQIVGVGQVAGETLEALYLRASHRRSGLGRRMLAELLAAAAARGAHTLRFNVHAANVPAQAFYAAQGARLVGRQWIRHPDGDWEDLVYEIGTPEA